MSPGALPHSFWTSRTDSVNRTMGLCVSTISSTRTNLPSSQVQPASRPTKLSLRSSIEAGFVCKARRSALSIQRPWPDARDDGPRTITRRARGAVCCGGARGLPQTVPIATLRGIAAQLRVVHVAGRSSVCAIVRRAALPAITAVYNAIPTNTTRHPIPRTITGPAGHDRTMTASSRLHAIAAFAPCSGARRHAARWPATHA